MDRLIIDLNSILTACHRAGKDAENGFNVQFNGETHYINSGEYAYEIFMLSYANTLKTLGMTPRQTVLVSDGKDSRQLRRSIYPEYKANRAQQPPELFEEFHAAVEGVVDEITGLGGLHVYQDLMEGDDVVAYLAQNLQGRKVIWSRDADMLALMAPDVDVLLDKELNPEVYKGSPSSCVALYKVLVGDSSDNLKGCPGLGEKTFTKLMLKYATELDDLMGMIKDRELHELDINEYTDLASLVKHQDSVYLAWACVKFYPERVNTARNPLHVKAQVVEVRDSWHPAVACFAPTKRLVTDPRELGRIAHALKSSPEIALDIETSTPAESDAWIDRILEIKSNKRDAPLDIMGSTLTGMSLTYGENMQHTIYMPVRHKDSDNLTSEQVAGLVEKFPDNVPVLIHNTAFELPVLFNEWGGWVDNAQDTMLMKSYVDENTSLGLKPSVKQYFGYKQATYEETTSKRGPVGTLPEGGKPVKAPTKPQIEKGAEPLPDGWEIMQYKMNQLTALEVFDYACDDTICTAALANRLKFTMELEHTWDVFTEVEIPAQYWVAEAFVNGLEIDEERLAEIAAEDDEAYKEPAAFVDAYLRKINWRGCEYTPFEFTNEGVCRAFNIIMGHLPPLKTAAKTEKGLITAVRKAGAPGLADRLADPAEHEGIEVDCRHLFVPTPDFDIAKDEHKKELFYDRLGLPVRFRTAVTDAQRAKGQTQGTPQVDKASVDHFLQMDLKEGSEEYKLLEAIRTMDQINTRRNLYYVPYPRYIHWKTGKVHSQAGQCKTATRRFAPSHINIAQVPKRGEGKKIREVFAARGIWVSADWSAQELALIAYRSGDQAMRSCFVGENKKDPHSITGASIAKLRGLAYGEYDEFVGMIKAENPDASLIRSLGKNTNFATAYGCQVPKLAKMLVVPQEEAAIAMKAKEAAYPGIVKWAADTVKSARELGYTETLLGARRHLHDKLNSDNQWAQMEAERQAINYTIQGSGAEQVKLAVNNIMADQLCEKTGAQFMFTVHDQADFVVPEENLVQFILGMHARMVQNYGNMDFDIMSEVSIGYNFGDHVKVGKLPTPENITTALQKLKEARNG